MEEYIGYGLVILVLATVIFLFKKLFKRNNDSLGNEDEIILDSDMVHYGPFSGSNCQQHSRKFVFLLAISSSFLAADLDIQTIDSWGIGSLGGNALVMQKTSDDNQSNFFIEMSRPFCICAEPMITTPALSTNYNEGDKIEAIMTVDKVKPKKMVFYVESVFESGVYLLRPKHFPSLRNAKNIKVKFPSETQLEDMRFNTNGMANAMKQSERICYSDYVLNQSEMQETKV
tara:strand:+ start:173 stop:862 length:690 start_codon:yes stop_codon:yes gene_type:complete